MVEEPEGKSRQVVHIVTTVTTQFGYIDGGGNLVPMPPVQMTFNEFKVANFFEAFEKMGEHREKLKG